MLVSRHFDLYGTSQTGKALLSFWPSLTVRLVPRREVSLLASLRSEDPAEDVSDTILTVISVVAGILPEALVIPTHEALAKRL